ncbi:hypothetical protein [Actinoplanes rectilineatus]|uniref:hypothetical protein n=1 Tax=Actinoplanes rectilineatus TaxID=113571 RepID=UPI0012FC0267|nr:hypothetical protein [Actinoplanes rectilineatus]
MSFEDDEYWEDEYSEYSFMPSSAVIQEKHYTRRTSPDPVMPTRRRDEDSAEGVAEQRSPRPLFDAQRPSWLDEPDFVPVDTSVDNLVGDEFDDIDFNRPELGVDFDKPDFPIVDPAARPDLRRGAPGDKRESGRYGGESPRGDFGSSRSSRGGSSRNGSSPSPRESRDDFRRDADPRRSDRQRPDDRYDSPRYRDDIAGRPDDRRDADPRRGADADPRRGTDPRRDADVDARREAVDPRRDADPRREAVDPRREAVDPRREAVDPRRDADGRRDAEPRRDNRRDQAARGGRREDERWDETPAARRNDDRGRRTVEIRPDELWDDEPLVARGRRDEQPDRRRPADARTTDPRGVDPRGVDPRAGDPRVTDPRGTGPRTGDPRVTDPRGTDPRGADPRTGDPRVTDPRGVDPRAGDPRVAGQRPGPVEQPRAAGQPRPAEAARWEEPEPPRDDERNQPRTIELGADEFWEEKPSRSDDRRAAPRTRDGDRQAPDPRAGRPREASWDDEDFGPIRPPGGRRPRRDEAVPTSGRAPIPASERPAGPPQDPYRTDQDGYAADQGTYRPDQDGYRTEADRDRRAAAWEDERRDDSRRRPGSGSGSGSGSDEQRTSPAVPGKGRPVEPIAAAGDERRPQPRDERTPAVPEGRAQVPSDGRTPVVDGRTPVPADGRGQEVDGRAQQPADNRGQGADGRAPIPADSRGQAADGRAQVPADSRGQGADGRAYVPVDGRERSPQDDRARSTQGDQVQPVQDRPAPNPAAQPGHPQDTRSQDGRSQDARSQDPRSQDPRSQDPRSQGEWPESGGADSMERTRPISGAGPGRTNGPGSAVPGGSGTGVPQGPDAAGGSQHNSGVDPANAGTSGRAAEDGPRVVRRAEPPTAPKVVSRSTAPAAPRVLKADPPVAPRIVAAPSPVPPARVIGPNGPEAPQPATTGDGRPEPGTRGTGPIDTAAIRNGDRSGGDTTIDDEPTALLGVRAPQRRDTPPQHGTPQHHDTPQHRDAHQRRDVEDARSAAGADPRMSGSFTTDPRQRGAAAENWQAGAVPQASAAQDRAGMPAARPTTPMPRPSSTGSIPMPHPSNTGNIPMPHPASTGGIPVPPGQGARPSGPSPSSTGSIPMPHPASTGSIPMPHPSNTGNIPMPAPSSTGSIPMPHPSSTGSIPVPGSYQAGADVPQQRSRRSPRTAHVVASSSDGPWAIVPDDMQQQAEGSRPTSPGRGYPGQPGGYPAGGYPAQPHPGGYQGQPQPGYPAQPQPSGYQGQPQPGGYPAQPQPGGYPTQPQPGGYPAQPQPGGYQGQPQPGGHPAQPVGPFPPQGPGGHPSPAAAWPPPVRPQPDAPAVPGQPAAANAWPPAVRPTSDAAAAGNAWARTPGPEQAAGAQSAWPAAQAGIPQQPGPDQQNSSPWSRPPQHGAEQPAARHAAAPGDQWADATAEQPQAAVRPGTAQPVSGGTHATGPSPSAWSTPPTPAGTGSIPAPHPSSTGNIPMPSPSSTGNIPMPHPSSTGSIQVPAGQQPWQAGPSPSSTGSIQVPPGARQGSAPTGAPEVPWPRAGRPTLDRPAGDTGPAPVSGQPAEQAHPQVPGRTGPQAQPHIPAQPQGTAQPQGSTAAAPQVPAQAGPRDGVPPHGETDKPARPLTMGDLPAKPVSPSISQRITVPAARPPSHDETPGAPASTAAPASAPPASPSTPPAPGPATPTPGTPTPAAPTSAAPTPAGETGPIGTGPTGTKAQDPDAPYMDPDGTLHNLKPIARLAVSGPDQEPRRYTDTAIGKGWFAAKIDPATGDAAKDVKPKDTAEAEGPAGPEHTGPELAPHLPMTAEELSAIRWRLDGGTLREVVDDRDALRELGERLDEPLADETDAIVKAGLLSVRAEVYRLLGELGMAAAASRLALAHAESAQDLQAQVIAQAELAHVLRLRGDSMEADRLFQRAVDAEVSPAVRSVVHENFGRSCFDQGRHMEALDHFARAVRLGSPEDTDLVERVGVCLEAVYIHVLRDGWGPYPRKPEDVLKPLDPKKNAPA